MKSHLVKDDPTQLDQPIKYLKINTFSEEIQGREYFYFMANKRNNSGIMYNSRFFLVIDNTHIGYANQCDANTKLPFRNFNKIPTLKASVKIQDISKCQRVDSLTILMSFDLNSVNMDNPPYWIIKLDNAEAASSVMRRIQQCRNKVALKLRGQKGLYEGPNGISMFKNQVEGKFSNKLYGKAYSEMKNIQQSHDSIQSQVMMHSATEIQHHNVNNNENPQLSVQVQKKYEAQYIIQQNILTNIQTSNLSQNDIRSYYWIEKIFTEQSYTQILINFNEQCNKIIIDLIDTNQINKENSLCKKYGINFLFIKNIISGCQCLQLLSQFENYKYVLSRTNNQGRIKIPLLCLVKYKGWLCLAKLHIPGHIIDNNSINDYTKKLAQMCRVDWSRWSAELTELDLSYFDKKQKNMPKHYFLTNLSKLLPTDTYLYSTSPHYISSECMNWLCKQNSFQSLQQQKIQQHIKQSFFTLVQKLNKHEQDIYSYSELQALFEKYHLTKQYFVPVYKKCKSKLMKQYLWVALLAEEIYNLYNTNYFTQNIVQQLNGLLKMRGHLWQQACLQLRHKCQVMVTKMDINKSYLVYFLIELFGLIVDEQKVGELLLHSDNHDIFNPQTTILTANIIPLDTYNNALWQKVKLLINMQYTQTIHQDLLWMLELNNNPLQIINWTENDLFTRLRLCLALFTAPPEVKSKATPYSESLYKSTLSSKPSLWKWKLGINRIKWLLLDDQVDNATIFYQKLATNIKQWSNDQHPILYELMTIMGRYHVLTHEYGKAIQYLEKGREVYKRLFPEDITQMINILTEVASAYQKNKEIRIALRYNIQIAKNMQEIELHNNLVYAIVQFNIGRQALHIENYSLARQAALKSIDILQNLNTKHDCQDQIVELYELLARIAEMSDKQLYHKICEKFQEMLDKLENLENIQRMLRIVLMPYLSQVLNERGKLMLAKLIEQIPKSTNSYARATIYLKKLIDQNKLIQLIEDCINNCEKLCLKVEQERLLENWMGLEEESTRNNMPCQFVCVIEALANFIGAHYMLGVISID